MAELSIQEKMNSYLASHSELKGKSEAVILSAMQKEGLVTQADIDSAKSTSAFGFGFQNTEDVGLSVQISTPQVKPVPVNNPVEITHLTHEQAQDFAIENIHSNLQKAVEVYHSVDNGTITQGYDSLKEFFDTELSSKNVSDVLNKEALSVAFLENAKNGTLTKREYYEKNKEHLKSLLIKRFSQQDETGVDALDKYKGNLSKEDFAKLIESYITEKIDTISTIQGIKDFQHEILMLDEEQNTQFIGQLAEEAKKHESSLSPDNHTLPKFKADSEKHPFDSEEPMTFEETYLLERGVEFSQNSMDILMQSEGELQFATSVYNKVNTLKTAIRDVQNEYKKQAKEFVDQKTGAYYYEEPDPNPRKDKITQIISEYYMLNPEQAKTDLDEIIQKSQLDLKVELNEDNNLSINFGERDNSSSQRNKNLNLLLSGLGKLQEGRLKEVLGGKDYDTYLMTYEYNYENALGKQNAEELANAMQMDNMTVIDSVTGTAAMGGMAMIVVGGVLTAFPLTTPAGLAITGVGGKVAIGGMAARNALGLTEAYTRENIDNEEVKSRYKDLAMDVGGLVIGGYAGRLGLQYGSELARNGASMLQSKIVEHGTDFIISVAGDMAMIKLLSYDQSMGETFKQNSIGIIVSTVTGISASKAMYGKQPTGVRADVTVRPETDVKIRGKSDTSIKTEAEGKTEVEVKQDVEAEAEVKTGEVRIEESNSASEVASVKSDAQTKNDTDKKVSVAETKEFLGSEDSLVREKYLLAFEQREEAFFHTFSEETQAKIIDTISRISETHNQARVYQLALNISDENLVLKIISDPKVTEQYCEEFGNVYNILKSKNTKNIPTKLEVNLALMKMYESDNFSKLTRDEDFKNLIQTDKLSYISDIKYDDKIDDHFVQDKLHSDRVQGRKAVEALDHLSGKMKELLTNVIELDLSQKDKIIKLVSEAKDPALMEHVLERINRRKNISDENLEKRHDKGLFNDPATANERDKNLIKLLEYASKNPEIVQKFLPFASKNIMEVHSIVERRMRYKKEYQEVLDPIIDKMLEMDIDDSESVLAAYNFLSRCKNVKLTDSIDLLLNIMKDKHVNNFTSLDTILDNVTQNNLAEFKKMLSTGTFTQKDLYQLMFTKNIPALTVDKFSMLNEYIDMFEYRHNAYAEELDKTYLDMAQRQAFAEYGAELKRLKDSGASQEEIDRAGIQFKKRLNQNKMQYDDILKSYNSTLSFVAEKYYSGLVDIKLNAPEKYQKILDSGVLELISEGKLHESILKLLNKSSDFSSEIYADLAMLKEGKSVIPEFKNITLKEAFERTKTGDTVEVDGKMFINDGEELIEWNMTKEKYLELFPPVQRFAALQQQIGDCYFLSAVNTIMSNPKARVQLYKSFELDGDNVAVTIKAYENYGGTKIYENGEINLGESGKYVYGCKGYQMLEQAYAQVSLRYFSQDKLPMLTKDTPSSKLTQRINGGFSHTVFHELLGIEYLEEPVKSSNKLSNNEKIDFENLDKAAFISVDDPHSVEQYLEQFAGNEDYIINFGTNSLIKEQYNLIDNHAYTIRGYDKVNKLVKISNPHNSAVVTEVPLNDFMRVTANLYIAPVKPEYKPFKPTMPKLQAKDAFISFDGYDSVLKPKVDKELWNIAGQLHQDALAKEKSIVRDMAANGLTPNDYEVTHRAKSVSSLYDKLKNFFIENYQKHSDVTLQDAIDSVKDAVGVRTIVKAKDYTQVPEVQALLKAGKRQEAVDLAAKLQSEEIFKNFKSYIQRLKDDGIETFGIIRISNYSGKGIAPYFSEAQLQELRILMDVGEPVKEGDPLFNEVTHEGIDVPEKDFLIKYRDAGYTAFQTNLTTKDGFTMEWQYRGKEVSEFEEAEHLQYDILTGKDVIKGKEYRRRLLTPTINLLRSKYMNADRLNLLNNHKLKYIKDLREKELGFEPEPDNVDYSKDLDKQLLAENILELHRTLHAIEKIESAIDKTDVQKNAEIQKKVEEYEAWLQNYLK